jgi:hypothetical protein
MMVCTWVLLLMVPQADARTVELLHVMTNLITTTESSTACCSVSCSLTFDTFQGPLLLIIIFQLSMQLVMYYSFVFSYLNRMPV